MVSTFKVLIGHPEKNSFELSFAYIRNASESSKIFSSYSKLFSYEDIKKLDHIESEVRKKNFILGRIAAKMACSSVEKIPCSSIRVTNGFFGQPLIGSNRSRVSISHTSSFAIAVVSPFDIPLGIDLEEIILPKSAKSISNYLGTDELHFFEGIDGCFELYLTMLWTAKEALSKFFLGGLSLDFKKFHLESCVPVSENSYWLSFEGIQHIKVYCSLLEGQKVLSVTLPSRSKPDWNLFSKKIKELCCER